MRHYVSVLAIVAVMAGGRAMLVRHPQPGDTPERSAFEVPGRFAGYEQVGEDVDVGDAIRRALESGSVLVRRYASPRGRPIQLTIVEAGATRRTLHFPQICFVGEGWTVNDQRSHPVGLFFEAQRLVLTKDGRREAVLYWFQTGDEVTGSYFTNAWHWAMQQLRGGAPTSALVRVSTPIVDTGEDVAFAALDDFAVKLAPMLQRQVGASRR